MSTNGIVNNTTQRVGIITERFKLFEQVAGISTTGIAGPNGATRKKPIGLVYIGIKYNSKTYIFKKIFIGSRLQIQKNTVKFIFITLKKLI